MKKQRKPSLMDNQMRKNNQTLKRLILKQRKNLLIIKALRKVTVSLNSARCIVVSTLSSCDRPTMDA